MHLIQGFSCIENFVVAARTNFCPTKAVFEQFVWFMSDVNDFCACDSLHVNWGRESPSQRTLSLGPFTPSHFMRFLWSDRYPILKRPVLWIQNTFEMDLNLTAQTTYVWGVPDETGQV